jgi:hypothetical protein
MSKQPNSSLTAKGECAITRVPQKGGQHTDPVFFVEPRRLDKDWS